MSEPDMKLPDGFTCGHCAHFVRCQVLIGAKDQNTWCDWSPSRFKLPRTISIGTPDPVRLKLLEGREALLAVAKALVEMADEKVTTSRTHEIASLARVAIEKAGGR